jgi:pimeloyl-ACP methyl ester carboxylesterase
VTLVGHDIGGMVAYAHLRAYQDLARAVIMDIVVPGVAPWEEFLRQPFLWHFALHAVAGLPERLVQDRQEEYFDYFYTVLPADLAKISGDARRAYANQASSPAPVTSPRRKHPRRPGGSSPASRNCESGVAALVTSPFP